VASGASSPVAASAAPPPSAPDSGKPGARAAEVARCNAINEQISLNLPVSAADRAFLQRGCRN
jgi:hypothetical protein